MTASRGRGPPAVRADVLRHGRFRHELGKALAVSMLSAWMCPGVVCGILLWALYDRWHPAITELPDLEAAF